MSHANRFTGSYDITGLDQSSNVTVTAHTLTVNGNLKVVGVVANVTTSNTQVKDNIITLNDGESGSGVTAGYAGIEVDRGLLTKTSIRWNEAAGRWELTNDGTTFSPINTVVGTMTQVYDDPSPQLGGNLDTLGTSIFSSNNPVVKFDSNLSIKYSTVSPSYISGYNTVYAKTPAGGGSGIYITNSTTQNQELVTKTKAIVYALIM